MKKPFVNLKNAGGGRPDHAYKHILQKIRRDGVCPFCREYLERYHKKPIIRKGRYWLLTDNMYPYADAAHHLLLIHKKHIEHLSEIAPAAWSELLALVRAAIKKRGIGGGTFYVRFGDPAYTNASVTHLHANLFSPDIRKKHDPIMFRVG